jgi:hypothetical protein
MADRDDRTDVDKLLAEVDGMLAGGGSTPQRPVQPVGETKGEPDKSSGWLVGQVRAAFMSGVGAGVVVWFVFAVLPFLRANSGAIGAFLGTFLAVLVFRRRR